MRAALVTQGARGCSLWTPQREFVRVPSFSSTVVDRVGAGDALFSVAAMACFMDVHEELVAFFGNVAGSLAVRILGNDKFVDRRSMKKYITATMK